MDRRFRFLTGVLAALFFCCPVLRAADWQAEGLAPSDVITCDALHDLFAPAQRPLIFDARDKRDYEIAHIQGARLPMSDAFYRELELYRNGILPSQPDPYPALASSMAGVSRDVRVAVYCSTNCTASAELVRELKRLGFAYAQVLDEGFQAWVEKGYPIEPNPNHSKEEESRVAAFASTAKG